MLTKNGLLKKKCLNIFNLLLLTRCIIFFTVAVSKKIMKAM